MCNKLPDKMTKSFEAKLKGLVQNVLESLARKG